VSGQRLGFLQDFAGDDCGEPRVTLVQELGKAI
jgi:hypothetical protein